VFNCSYIIEGNAVDEKLQEKAKAETSALDNHLQKRRIGAYILLIIFEHPNIFHEK